MRSFKQFVGCCYMVSLCGFVAVLLFYVCVALLFAVPSVLCGFWGFFAASEGAGGLKWL